MADPHEGDGGGGVGGVAGEPFDRRHGVEEILVAGAGVVEESLEADREKEEAAGRSPASDASAASSPIVGFVEQDANLNFDMEESWALQLADDDVSSSIDLSRAISTVVGPGMIERHFGTWRQIDLILASIPGVKIAITTTTSTKLKTRDFRKIHTQDALSLNLSSIPALTKPPKPKFSSKAAQQFFPPSKPSKNPIHSQKPKTSRPSRPSKTSRPSQPSKTVQCSKPSSTNPKQTFSFPLPTPEWMAMMDRSMVPEPGQEGSSKGPGKDPLRPPVKESRSMADVLKRVQPRATNGPIILDASRVKQRGTATQEDGIPCLNISSLPYLRLMIM